MERKGEVEKAGKTLHAGCLSLSFSPLVKPISLSFSLSLPNAPSFSSLSELLPLSFSLSDAEERDGEDETALSPSSSMSSLLPPAACPLDSSSSDAVSPSSSLEDDVSPPSAPWRCLQSRRLNIGARKREREREKRRKKKTELQC